MRTVPSVGRERQRRVGEPLAVVGCSKSRFGPTGASSRTLSQSLDALIETGLVERWTEEASPIAVFYGLTEKGEDLGSVFDELDAWARKWVDIGT